LARADRACAVSPFIDRQGLGEVLEAGAKRLTLLTTESAGAACAPLPGVDFRTHTAPDPAAQVSVEQQQEGSEGEFVEPPSTGIHAKLVAIAKGTRTALMLGSANLTRRGLVGPNAEAIAILELTDTAMAKSLFDFAESGLPLDALEPDADAVEREKSERRLDELISEFLRLPVRLTYDDGGLVLVVPEDAETDALERATFSASPFLEPEAWIGIPPEGGSVRLLAGPIALSEQTTLVNFRATSADDPAVGRRWVQAIPIKGFDDARRDRALLARYVGASRFREWLRSLLDGVDGTGGQRWTDDPRGSTRLDPAGRLAEIFTLETMLSAWARDPVTFESRIAGMMGMLDSFAEAFATIPDDKERDAALADIAEVRPFLEALEDAIGTAR
jgi:hypothetical protein